MCYQCVIYWDKYHKWPLCAHAIFATHSRFQLTSYSPSPPPIFDGVSDVYVY